MAEISNFEDLLNAGAHFGHLRRKWDPQMAPYIFAEKKGIHVIDLKKTQGKITEAQSALKQLAAAGKKILFVATKKQAKKVLADKIEPTGMPYITERWPGGMLTNFATVRRAIRKMNKLDKMLQDPENELHNVSKRERLSMARERDKLKKNLGSVSELNRLPAAVFIIDVVKEEIAVHEANKLDLTTFAIVDTNADPDRIDYPVPANDDASESISVVLDDVVSAINEGLEERKAQKAKKEKKEAEQPKEQKVVEEEDRSGEKKVQLKSKKEEESEGEQPAGSEEETKKEQAGTGDEEKKADREEGTASS